VEYSRQAHNRAYPAVEIAQTAARDYVNAKACRDQLGRPGAVLEEHQLELIPQSAGAFESHLEHRLGAAKPLPPWERHDYAHGS
jgi:hypothetical protein